MRDPQGNIYYQNNITRETTRIHPANLPPGWTESKDPDGKPFFVHHELQLASWCRPGQQPLLAASTTAAKPAAIPKNQASRPSLTGNPPPSNMRPQSIAMTTRPNGQGQRPAASSRPGQQQVSLATATEATINLFDPSNGGIVRNTKIVSHIAGQSVKGTVKAVAQNQRLQTFARGTGLAMANKKVKKAWRKAAKEVASLDGHRKQEIYVTQSGPQGKIAVQGADTDFEGEYVIEYEDGTIEYYDAKERLLRTSTVGPQRPAQQNPNLVQRPGIQQRPPLQIQSHQIPGQQLVLQPAQQQIQVGQAQVQQPQLQQNMPQAFHLPQGSLQQGQIQNSQTQQVQSQPIQPQQEQLQSQPQAQQSQNYQGHLQQAAQGQLQQSIQAQLQPSQPQQGPANQAQTQSQAQQNQCFLAQLQQVAQDQVRQVVQQHLAQTQPTQSQQSQSQVQQAQAMLQRQQAQNQQMEQQLKQVKLQSQQNFNQQLQQLQQQQQMASRPAPQPQYTQNQPSLLDQAVSVLQQSTQQPQTVYVDQVPTQTVYMDQSPAQAIYIDQAPAQTLFVDKSVAQQTAHIDQTAYTQDQVVYTDGSSGDVNVEVTIEQNVYIDQNYQDQSYVVQEETGIIEEGSCDQVYELRDDGCMDVGFEVDSGDCGGFEDGGFDF